MYLFWEPGSQVETYHWIRKGYSFPVFALLEQENIRKVPIKKDNKGDFI